jgi:hypothetical protein
MRAFNRSASHSHHKRRQAGCDFRRGVRNKLGNMPQGTDFAHARIAAINKQTALRNVQAHSQDLSVPGVSGTYVYSAAVPPAQERTEPSHRAGVRAVLAFVLCQLSVGIGRRCDQGHPETRYGSCLTVRGCGFRWKTITFSGSGNYAVA